MKMKMKKSMIIVSGKLKIKRRIRRDRKTKGEGKVED